MRLTMSSIAISSIVFACVFGGAFFGIFIRAALPQHHLSADSKDVVKLGMGLVATLSALVLGLLIVAPRSAKRASEIVCSHPAGTQHESRPRRRLHSCQR
jgi:hypothetical protein